MSEHALPRCVLAVETSCDDTCAAVVEGTRVLSNVIASQDAAHEEFGGIVPEVAARHHLDVVIPVVDQALANAERTLDDVDAIAVTDGPGLIGALLMGVNSAKALAAPRKLPLIPVDHLYGHIAANFLDPEPLDPPFLCLVVSGGHTFLAAVREQTSYEVLGQTLDDAAGEAFDKAARMLGLGFPGGPALEKAAGGGESNAHPMPVAMTRNPGLDFSFSGLKTALSNRIRSFEAAELQAEVPNLAASFQEAVVGQLVAKLSRALDQERWPAVAIGGGVAANGLLRERVGELCEERGLRLGMVEPRLCTDNAAMIASAARFSRPLAYPDYLSLDAVAAGMR